MRPSAPSLRAAPRLLHAGDDQAGDSHDQAADSHDQAGDSHEQDWQNADAPAMATLRRTGLPMVQAGAVAVGIGVVRLYQWTLRPLIGSHCRFWPSCSEYAVEALRLHGAARGTLLATKRILRCNPWHEGGVDPVPGVDGNVGLCRDRHGQTGLCRKGL